jgi:type IV pilus assembly protein PilM
MFDKPMIAIDIGSSSVKVVELMGRGQRKLGCIGLEVFGTNAIADGEIKDPDVVADVVSDLLYRLKIKTKGRRAAVALGGSGILIKRAMIQPSNDTEFSEQVFYEAQQLFHHDMDDMYFRYQEIQTRQPVGDKKAVILVGAKRYPGRRQTRSSRSAFVYFAQPRFEDRDCRLRRSLYRKYV